MIPGRTRASAHDTGSAHESFQQPTSATLGTAPTGSTARAYAHNDHSPATAASASAKAGAQGFDALGLAPQLLRAIADEGYEQPTPIQERAIPVVLSGRDVLAAAQTGTGKTAAFVLPILDRLTARGNSAPIRAYGARTLILTPTRELAAQIHESVRSYGRHLKLRSTVVYGGVGMQNQVNALRRGVDVLVATPGRLLDHHGQKTVDLRGVEILVLDEADRMLDMGFIQAIRRVLSLLPQTRQNLLFSATFSPEIRELAGGLLKDPATVEVARVQTTAALIEQAVHYVDEGRKRELLAHLIETGEWNQVLVFTRTKHRANRLAEQLDKEGISADAIHGNKSQGARTRALADFKANRVRVLVATDIAARGIDIEELPHVVNFDLPHVPEDYVHRIGRTGRAGSSGAAVSLVSAEDRDNLGAIEKLVKTAITVREVPGFTLDPSKMARVSAPAREAQRRPQRPQRPSRPSTRQGKSQSARGGRGSQGRRG